LLIAADRRIADCTIDLRGGIWNKKLYSKAPGLKGRKLAIIGMGAIGYAVAKRARAFEMNVCGWSRSFSAEKAEELGMQYCGSPEDAFRDADAVSVHLAAAPETEHFVDGRLLSMMRDGGIFINTSRGEIIDTEALKRAIAEKGIRAALDVYEDEPGAASNKFSDTGLAAVITGTHHIGASTDEASEAIAEEVVRVISAYKQTGTPLNEVNLREKSETDINLVVRHFNRVGVLAGVLDEIRNSGINIEEMQNSIFEGGKAAVCTIKLDNIPDKELVRRISLGKDIINISVK
jgi:D-3-phosphoglycerate dehydrogenase